MADREKQKLSVHRDQLIGWREAARESGFRPYAMYVAFRDGDAPSFRFRRKLYCDRAEFEKWLKSKLRRRKVA